MTLISQGVLLPAVYLGGHLGQCLTLRTSSRLNFRLHNLASTPNFQNIFQMEGLRVVLKMYLEQMVSEVFGLGLLHVLTEHLLSVQPSSPLSSLLARNLDMTND